MVWIGRNGYGLTTGKEATCSVTVTPHVTSSDKELNEMGGTSCRFEVLLESLDCSPSPSKR